MREKISAADLHGYADRCLKGDALEAVEIRLREDPDIRRQIEAWREQSRALQQAFGISAGPGASAGPGGGPPREAARFRRIADEAQAAEGPVRKGAKWSNRETSQTFWSAVPRWVFALLIVAGFVLVPGARSVTPLDAVRNAGIAAFRAFSALPPDQLDYRAIDAGDLLGELGPDFRYGRLQEWLGAPGWKLRGAKRTPGALSIAVLTIVDRDDREPVGILVEPLDAPRSDRIVYKYGADYQTAIFDRDGYGVVAISGSAAALRDWLSAALPDSVPGRKSPG